MSYANVFWYEIFSKKSIIKERFDNDNILIICFRESGSSASLSKLFLKFYINNFEEADAEGEFIKSE